MTTLIPFTTEEKIKELQRELAMRRQVYPRHCPGKMGHGYMAPAKQRQISILEAIIQDYETGAKT